tara:strand:+ start:365 stop:943 length:579 start_codon:yes stop_codon:yes gene_type:complete
MFKHGAMFGLDARIALAIFGALSVISGAALYSAIQESKVIATVVDFKEAQKAWEAYYLDTGEEVPYSSGGFFDSSYLVEDNSVNGWQGPYLPFIKNTSSPLRLKHNKYTDLLFVNTEDVAWGEGGDNWAIHTCPVGGVNCYSWVMFIGTTDLAFVQAIDKKIDNSIDPQNGDFRYYQTGGIYRMALKNMKYK